MEKNLEKVLEDITHQPGVIGAICADKQGLCLAVKGQVSPEVAGVTATMTDLASKLAPEESHKSPIIALETDTSHCLIQRQDNVVLTVVKSTHNS